MSATIAAISALRSGLPRLTTNTRTGSSNLRMRSTGRSNCNSARNAVLKKPSLISSLLKLVRWDARRTTMSEFSAKAVPGVPPAITVAKTTIIVGHVDQRRTLLARQADEGGGRTPLPQRESTEFIRLRNMGSPLQATETALR